MSFEEALLKVAAGLEKNAAAIDRQTDMLDKLKREGSGAPPPKEGDKPATGGRRSTKDKDAKADPRSFCPDMPKDLTIGAFKDFVTAWKEVGGANDDPTANERDARAAFIIRITKHFDVERVSHVEPEFREPVLLLLKKYASDPKVDIAAELSPDGKDGKRGDDYV